MTQNHTQDKESLIALRLEKLKQWRKDGHAYPTDFRRDTWSSDLLKKYDSLSDIQLNEEAVVVKVAGRIMTRRLMGKASFIHIQDMMGQIQLYIRENDVGETQYEAFKHWDLGDIIGAHGLVFKTKTGELSVKVTDLRLLTKAIRPLPDKFHGLADQEIRYRQRYLDLITNNETQTLFRTRAKIIDIIRHFLHAREFLEVETPMMQLLAGGAAARPFITHHHTFDLPLYLRIAPELYLKRLVIGGFERVYEINRNFRNEGVSTQHNPEFTMLEFYEAYADYQDMMDLTEELLEKIAIDLFGVSHFSYQAYEFDFSKPFLRMSLFASILHFNPGLVIEDLQTVEAATKTAEKLDVVIPKDCDLGKIQTEIFEKTVEHQLIQPTFITEYPAIVSPLARRNDHNPFVVDRFELFIAGREIANGFCELNDPEDQASRFKEQMQQKKAGDEEAMPYDQDYITALEYGLPPTAGEGIGIDRLVMLFTNAASIRDVILFPQMRPKEGD